MYRPSYRTCLGDSVHTDSDSWGDRQQKGEVVLVGVRKDGMVQQGVEQLCRKLPSVWVSPLGWVLEGQAKRCVGHSSGPAKLRH